MCYIQGPQRPEETVGSHEPELQVLGAMWVLGAKLESSGRTERTLHTHTHLYKIKTRVLVGSPGWFQIQCPPASAFPLLELQVYITIPCCLHHLTRLRTSVKGLFKVSRKPDLDKWNVKMSVL